MPHDLVLFDLDGTLSDPLEGIGRSINYSLVHFGYEPLEFSRLAAFVGPPLDETFRTITGVNTEFDLKALVAKYRERYAEVGYSENVLYPGIAEALAILSKTGVPMAVCTSKRVDFAGQILEMFGLRHYFRYVDGGEIGIQKWQQVEALLLAGKVSQSSVMVGDRSVDIVAAHRNGLKAAAVLWGYGSHAELSSEHPLYFFGSPSELPQLAPG
jgi:phosphoglycolate phosphatase